MDYQEIITNLQNLRLHPVGAAADMLWVHFGGEGSFKENGDWALHLQCPWRFVKDGKIILASSDFYYDSETGDQYDWESEQISLFKKNATILNKEIESSDYRVTSIVCSEAGAFDLYFDDLKFSVFPSESEGMTDPEAWRLFEPDTDNDHYVYPE